MKKILSLFIAAIMCFSLALPTFAEETSSLPSENNILVLPDCEPGTSVKVPVGDAEYIEDSNGNLIKISDLISFDSQDAADDYVEQLRASLENTIQLNPQIEFNPLTRATHGSAVVAVKEVVFNGRINLCVVYTTSGDSNTGTITYHDAYTTFTGFSLGFSWEESTCASQVTSSGKDIFAYTAGVLVYNFLVDGFIEIGREPVNLAGYCYAIH